MTRGKGVPGPLRVLARTTALIFGGLFTLSVASSITIRSLQAFSEAKRVSMLTKPKYITDINKWESTAEKPATDSLIMLSDMSLKSDSYSFYKKIALPCKACKGTGFYECKLCKGNSTIEWSPLYDPVFINPCVCPTCEGNRVQRCLNCLGKGYA